MHTVPQYLSELELIEQATPSLTTIVTPAESPMSETTLRKTGVYLYNLNYMLTEQATDTGERSSESCKSTEEGPEEGPEKGMREAIGLVLGFVFLLTLITYCCLLVDIICHIFRSLWRGESCAFPAKKSE